MNIGSKSINTPTWVLKDTKKKGMKILLLICNLPNHPLFRLLEQNKQFNDAVIEQYMLMLHKLRGTVPVLPKKKKKTKSKSKKKYESDDDSTSSDESNSSDSSDNSSNDSSDESGTDDELSDSSCEYSDSSDEEDESSEDEGEVDEVIFDDKYDCAFVMFQKEYSGMLKTMGIAFNRKFNEKIKTIDNKESKKMFQSREVVKKLNTKFVQEGKVVHFEYHGEVDINESELKIIKGRL
jgi:hypothetical protein